MISVIINTLCKALSSISDKNYQKFLFILKTLNAFSIPHNNHKEQQPNYTKQANET